MGYRKFAADQLFTGSEMLGNDAVLITDYNGVVAGITNISAAGEGIERYNGILTPGFINAHCHLELSHMKGKIPPGTGMVKFLLTVMSERFIAEEEIEEAIRFEEQFMREKGIVAVADICNTLHTLNIKKSSQLFFQNFIEATGFVDSSAELRFKQAHDIYLRFVEEWSTSSIVPHAPYSVSDELFRRINKFVHSGLLSMHNQESEVESEFFAYATGGFLELYRSLKIDVAGFKARRSSSLIHSLEMIDKEHTLLLVHNVHTTQDDLDWIEKNEHAKLHWCICPNANLHINNQLPNIPLLKKNGCRMLVGTDSLASNIQLNILEELKTLQLHYPELTTTELLQWATSNGADALRISKRYGSFEEGKKPGVVIIHGGTNGMLAGTVSRRIL